MKVNLRYLFLFVLAIGFMTACDDDDKYTPDNVVQTEFEEMFPDVGRVDWKRKSGYIVADFRMDSKEKKAWFTTAGVWMLTETDIVVADIPTPIVDNIAGGQYAGWKVEDAEYIERKDMESVYVIEVESGKQEVDLYYSPEGKLLKTVKDGRNHQILPTPVNEKVLVVVNAKYPYAKILEIDLEANFIEVDLVRDNLYFEMILDKEYNWVQSVYETEWIRVPNAVKITFASDGYTFNAEEDEVEMLMRPDTDGSEMIVYRIELDKELQDIILYYTDEGVRLNS